MIRFPGLHSDEVDLVQVLMDMLEKENDRGASAMERWSAMNALGIPDVIKDRSCYEEWARRLFLVGYATGRAAAPNPLASIVAADTLTRGGDGPVDLTTVVGTLGTNHLTANQAGDTWRVSGRDVVDGLEFAAQVIVTVASDVPGTCRVLAADVSGVRRLHHQERVDSRGLSADIELVDAPAIQVAVVDRGLVEKAAAIAGLILVGESIGIHERWLTETAEHLRSRHQFGAPLAARQGARHALVDWWVVAEQVRALGWRAARAAAHPARVAAARAMAGRAAHVAVATSIQLHGGVGMVDELPLGRSMRRLLETTAVTTTTNRSRAMFALSPLSRPRLTDLTTKKEQR